MSKNQTSFEYLLLVGGVLVFVLLVVAVGVNISGKTGNQATSNDVQVNTFQDWKLNCYNYGVLDRNSTVAYYNFDSDYKDKSGNKRDLQGTGNPFISSGRIKGGLKLSTTTDMVNNSAIGYLFNFTTSTVTFWINTTTSNGYIVNHSARPSGWNISLVSGNLAFSQNGQTNNLGIAINDGKWHHVAITQNTSGYYAWVDGISQGNFVTTYAAATYTGDMFIGSNTAGFVGGIDDFKFYNKSLTSLDVLQDMNCTTVTS